MELQEGPPPSTCTMAKCPKFILVNCKGTHYMYVDIKCLHVLTFILCLYTLECFLNHSNRWNCLWHTAHLYRTAPRCVLASCLCRPCLKRNSFSQWRHFSFCCESARQYWCVIAKNSMIPQVIMPSILLPLP